MRQGVILPILSAALLATAAAAQPQRVEPRARQRPPTEALDPAKGISDLYGVSNLLKTNRPDGTAKSLPDFKTLNVPAEDILSAQNKRRQPPPSLDQYTVYIHSDDLLRTLEKFKGLPNLDPAVPILMAWNHIALDMTSIDHTTLNFKEKVPGAPGDELPRFEPTYGEQFGPPRSSRAMAIVHLAMFEAANVLDPRYETYTASGEAQGLRDKILQSLARPAPTKGSASLAAAISEAAFRTLTDLYPKKTSLLEASKVQIALLIATQEKARDPSQAQARIDVGAEVGKTAAEAVLAVRQGDGSNGPEIPDQCGKRFPNQPEDTIIPVHLCKEEYFKSGEVNQPDNPFKWTIDPVSKLSLKLGSFWGNVKPFVIDQSAFVTEQGIATAPGKVIPLPKSTDARVVQALNEGAYGPRIRDPHGSGVEIRSKYGVRRYGTDSPPAHDGRTAEQTQWAQFWGYDATALLCAPPRLYNMVATSIYLDRLKGASADPHAAVRAARYLALTNIALADAGIAAWDAKFKYSIARPVTFLRDHEPAAPGDPNWTPLGQVASNGLVPNTTPPFPAYPSGHATFGAAIFQMIAKILDINASTRESKFHFVSDEYNGHTIGRDGQPRKFLKAYFRSLNAAKWENAESRIWLGVHWQQDADDGVALGDGIADAIYARTLKPLR